MARSPSIRAALEQAKAEIIRIGRDAAPSLIDDKGNARRRAAQNMAKRFRQHAEAYFAFITTPGMVQTNNVAKQAIRFVIIDRHVTQGTRGANGRRANERLWTVIATRALQGRSAFAFTLDAVWATYPMTRVDADGEPLDSSKHRNRLTFASGELPPVNAFWSITMYDGKSQLLVKNPIDRYLINSPMLTGMEKNEDGSLTLYIQKDSPGQARESNWLPAPDGPMFVVMRLYWPKIEPPSIIFCGDGTWDPPNILVAD